MKTKIEIIYEKLAVEAATANEDKLMITLLKAVHMLEVDRHTSISDRDVDYPQLLKISIADVMYYLLMVASKHGACIECLADIMESKYNFKDKLSITVPQPKVINKDNTGPAIK